MSKKRREPDMRIVAFEVHPIMHLGGQAINCSPESADFWSLYGCLPRADGSHDLICIGDYNTESDAWAAAELLMRR